MEGGREITGWLKADPKVRWVREGGRKATGPLKVFPKVTWVIKVGRMKGLRERVKSAGANLLIRTFEGVINLNFFFFL